MFARAEPSSRTKNNAPPGLRLLQRCGDHPCPPTGCHRNDDTDEKAKLLRTTEREPASTHAPPIVGEVLRSSGQPLDAATSQRMSAAFGFDFSGVRIHNDGRASESAQAVGALAYTVGSDIVFTAGRYSPASSAGAHLLAHELAHVVQQAGTPSSSRNGGDLVVSDPGDGPEREAAALATAVVQPTFDQRVTRAPPDTAPTGVPAQVVAWHSLSTGLLARAPAGEPQRQPRPATEKSGQHVEATYRFGARTLSDPRLLEAADDVRRCREMGGRACQVLVTDDDLWTMYGQYRLVEDAFGEDAADQALRESRLAEAAQQAVAAEEAPGVEMVAAGTATAAVPRSAPGGVPAPTRTPLVGLRGGGQTTPARNPSLRIVRPVTPGPGLAPSPGIRPGPGLAAVAIVFGVLVVVDLYRFSAFQRKAFDAGYKYLPAPRGVCMRGCHSPAPTTLPRQLEVPTAQVPAPRAGPLSPRELAQLERWIDDLSPSPRGEPARDRPDKPNNCEDMKRAGLVDHTCGQLYWYQWAGRDLRSARNHALKRLRTLNPDADLDAYKDATTTDPPCAGKGTHTNVRDRNGIVVRDPDDPTSRYFGSIVCCPCCVEQPTGPVIEARCGLV